MRLPKVLADLISRFRPRTKEVKISEMPVPKPWAENKHAHLRFR